MNRAGLTTLKQIAAATGVHTSTVSRALDPQKRHLVADDVAERIVHLAQSLGYQPNRVATSLRTGRSHLIGVLLPDIANPVFAPILSGIAESLASGLCKAEIEKPKSPRPRMRKHPPASRNSGIRDRSTILFRGRNKSAAETKNITSSRPDLVAGCTSAKPFLSWDSFLIAVVFNSADQMIPNPTLQWLAQQT